MSTEKSVSFSDRVGRESGKQPHSLKKTEAFRQVNRRRMNPDIGYSSTEPFDDREKRTQTPKEYDDALRDPTDKYRPPPGNGKLTKNQANELFFNGIDPKTSQAMFCDKLGKCFILGAAALASAKAFGLFGGKTQKTKRIKNKNRKTKRRR
jgi:hypothetical protein